MSTFATIVCGIDGSPEAIEAARQAAALVEPGGRLVLASIADVGAGERSPEIEGRLRAAAEGAVAAAAAMLPERGVTTVVRDGDPLLELLELVRSERATLLAVGSKGAGRVVGVLLGSVTTSALHDAPCSVLVARATRESRPYPRSVVVAVDPGEPHEQVVAAVAELERRFAVASRKVAAVGYERVGDLRRIQAELPGVELMPELPLDAILDSSRDADLVVVGSRGRRGLRSLGSVSERVAHRARCSVLVVR